MELLGLIFPIFTIKSCNNFPCLKWLDIVIQYGGDNPLICNSLGVGQYSSFRVFGLKYYHDTTSGNHNRNKGKIKRNWQMGQRWPYSKIAPGVYISNLEETPEKIIRRNWYRVVSDLFPEAFLSHRSALKRMPTATGHLYLTYTNKIQTHIFECCYAYGNSVVMYMMTTSTKMEDYLKSCNAFPVSEVFCERKCHELVQKHHKGLTTRKILMASRTYSSWAILKGYYTLNKVF